MKISKMSYLETIEFLVKEVAKKDQEIKSLSIALDSKSTLVKDLEALSDKRLEYLVAERDAAEDLLKKDEDNQSYIKRLILAHDKHLEKLNDKEDKIEDLEATLESVEARLDKMTKEAEFWRIDAKDWVDNREPKWRAERKQYEDEIEELKSSIVSINQDRIKVVGHLEDKIRSLTAEVNQAKTRDKYLNDIIKKSDAAYENKIAKLQVEINHLKNNK